MPWGRPGRIDHCTGIPAACSPATAAWVAWTGDHLVGIAMDEVHGRPAPRFLGQALAAEQGAGEAEHRGGRALPPGRDVESGHRALGEADQRQLVVPEPVALELGIEEGIEERRDALDPEQQRVGPPVPQREPLPPEWGHVAGLGSVGRDKGRARQPAGKRGRERDQVGAVGAHAVQQHDQLAGRAAGPRRHARSGQRRHTRRKSAIRILSIAAPPTIIAALHRASVFPLISMPAP
jgi:hypothetical protein